MAYSIDINYIDIGRDELIAIDVLDIATIMDYTQSCEGSEFIEDESEARKRFDSMQSEIEEYEPEMYRLSVVMLSEGATKVDEETSVEVGEEILYMPESTVLDVRPFNDMSMKIFEDLGIHIDLS